jgi:hypothetical protein
MFQLRLAGVRVSADFQRMDEREMSALSLGIVMPTKVGTQTTIREDGVEACLGPGLRREDAGG